MEEYMFSQGKAMRCGYTTGSCAAAAAKAAAVMVLGRQRLDQVILHTPRGMDLSLRPEDVRFGPQSVSCAIRKDSGDDPDITDGMLVYAEVVLKEKSGVELLGGSGVGTVTKAGLSCRPCQARTCARGALACLRTLDDETVFQAVLARL